MNHRSTTTAADVTRSGRPSRTEDLAPRALRVLHVISTLQMGGAPKGTVELVHALDQQDNVEVQLCAIGNTGSPIDTSHLRHVPIDLGCSVHARRLTRRRRREIRRLVNEFQPDVVHSHLWPAAREVAWAIQGLPLPHLVHIRDTPPSFVQRRWQSRFKNLWLRYSLSSRRTHFVAVSNAARDYAVQHLGLPADRVALIVNGIDPGPLLEVARRRVYRRDGHLVIGTAARLSPSKGIGDLIEAVRQLVHSGRDVTLLIAGEGSLRPNLEAQCAEAGLRNRVEFVGKVDTLPEFLGSLDLFAFASLEAEGLPRVLLEAMASGLPLVTTDCEGVDNISALSQCGLVVPRGNAAAIAEAIGILIDEPEERIRRGKMAVSSAERDHSIERVSREVMDTYRRLIPQTAQGRCPGSPRC